MSANPTLLQASIGHQISVFIENRPGTLGEVIDILRENRINMLALSLSEGIDIGYLRIAVDKLAEAKACLEKAGHLVLDKPVILLEVANKPGGLASAIDRWAAAGINIDYAYSANSPGSD
ncbi:MAG: hypothetical protein KDL31_04230, partial [Kiritimatiellae bacterium]|nr:hypothetical protein [Kiritimatiellia bacterium]